MLKFLILLSIYLSTGDARLLSQTSPSGISFSGGGFRAHAVASGTIAGFLGAGKQISGETSYSLTNLMQNFQYVSSNSGGSWFTAQFVYSPNFVQMLEQMSSQGTNAAGATSIYTDQWTDNFMKVSGVPSLTSVDSTNTLVKLVEELLSFIDGSFVSWAELIINYFFDQNTDWTSFVNSILSAPGDLDPTQPLSSANVNTWASNKVYAIAGSLTAPSSIGVTSGAFDQNCQSTSGSSEEESVIYQYTGGSSPGTSMPIMFSTTLNGNSGSESPFAFINQPSSTSFAVTYSVQSSAGIFSMGSTLSSSEITLSAYPGPGMHSNSISILDAVSTSSAFLSSGISAYQNFNKLAISLDDIDVFTKLLQFVVPAALNPSVSPSSMFAIGASAITPASGESCTDWASNLQSQSVMTVADGGYIDNTGLSGVLANANDGDAFTVILNGGNTGSQDLYELFQGSDGSSSSIFSQIPVFQEDQAFITSAQNSFPGLTIVSDASELVNITYGTVVATTTNQPYFGVTAGKSITLNCIIVSTNMALAPSNWNQPGTLAGEIVATLQSSTNSIAVQSIIEKFF